MRAFVTVIALLVAVATATPASICWKNTHDRGVGKPITACADPSHPDWDAGLCYESCRTASPSFYGIGPVCWQHCKPGFVDEGALCRKDGSIYTYAKDSYGRGVGKPMTCKVNQQYDAGLCYPFCPANMTGVGPVCWADCSSTPDKVSNGAICCKNGTICSQKIRDLVMGIPVAVMEAILSGGNATRIEESALAALGAVVGFVMPLCNTI
jgi:hypothetical protein